MLQRAVSIRLIYLLPLQGKLFVACDPGGRADALTPGYYLSALQAEAFIRLSRAFLAEGIAS